MSATPDVSLLKTLKARAAEHPERVYVQTVDGPVMTYGDALDQSLRWANAYRRLGVQRGDHVVTMQYNTMESLWVGWDWHGSAQSRLRLTTTIAASF